MLFFQIVLKNLRQRFTRTALTIVGLAVAVAAMTTLWTIAWGYASSSENFYADRGVDIVVVRAGVSNRLTSNLQMDVADRIRALSDVEQVDGSLTEMVSLGESNLLGIPMRGYLPTGSTIDELAIRDGRTLIESSTGEVLLGSGLADVLQKTPGQSLEIEGKRFVIAGVFYADNPFDANSVIASLSEVQELMGRAGIVSEFQVQAAARNDTSLNRICQAIESLGNDQRQSLGLRAQPTHSFVDSATESRLSSAMALATTVIVVVLSFIGVLNAMLMSVMERTREFGLLRAIGWKRWRVVQMVLSESVVITGVAAVLGVLLSCLTILILRQWPATSLLVPHNISLFAAELACMAALAAAIAGSFYPAFHATRVTPIESLRHE